MNTYEEQRLRDLFARRQAAHDAEMQRQREESAAENEAIRKQLLAKLKAERREQQIKHQQEIDNALEPIKQERKRQWLVAHPDRSEADFDQLWTKYMRAAVLEEQRTAHQEQIKQQLRKSGDYAP